MNRRERQRLATLERAAANPGFSASQRAEAAQKLVDLKAGIEAVEAMRAARKAAAKPRSADRHKEAAG
jgi:hypothetical protein